MKRNIIFLSFVLGILIIGIASASPILTRTLPDKVNSGENFNVTYTASGLMQDSWYVAFDDRVVGDCYPSHIVNSMVGLNRDSKSVIVSVRAPSINTTCNFSGSYNFDDGIQRLLPTKYLQVGDLPFVIPEPVVVDNSSLNPNQFINETDIQTAPVTSSSGICKITEKIAFFELPFVNKCTSGGIIGVIVIFIILKLLL